ncbi:MAG: ABC transporter ATP-binding protein [Eubacterium sp.]|nr:ABC transporter ATP-binding protein [Eubacterium sp.]
MFKEKKYLKNIWKLFYNYRRSFIIILTCLFCLLGINYLLPFLSRSLIDDGFIKGDKIKILYTVLSILGLNMVVIIINIFKKKQAVRLNIGIRTQLEREAFQHLLNLRISYFYDKNATSTYQCIQEDINSISSIADESMISAVTALFSAIGGGIALFIIDWRLGLAVIAVTPLGIGVSSVFAKKNKALIEKLISLHRRYSGWYGETVLGAKEIRLFGLQNHKRKELEKQLKDINTTTENCYMLLTYNEQVQDLLVELLRAFIYILAAFLMIKSKLTVGSIIAFQTYMLMVSGSELTIIQLFIMVYSLIPNVKRYYGFLDEPTEKRSEGHVSFTDGNIEFKDICFSYSNNQKEVLHDINLKLSYGDKVVVVGDNGVGKTTFINLLLSFLEPDRGKIMVNGKSISDINIDEYRQLFSVVSQEVFLFNDTLKNNICLGKEVSDELLEDTIREVNLEDFVRKNGTDYIITNNGANLSGGQRQKIALARALIINRPILVFDEATSNLDRMSMNIFTDLFETKLKDTTVICVSHSEEIINCFDNRISISDGYVVMERI